MPTEQWFKENPKVSGYISKELDFALTEWMEANSIQKVSQALTIILKDYLLGSKISTVSQSDRIAALELKFESLEALMQPAMPCTSVMPKEPQSFPKASTEEHCHVCNAEGVGYTLMPSGYYLCPKHSESILNRLAAKH